MAKEDQIEQYRFDNRTAKEQREIARQGGIKSGEVRRQKATMKAVLEKILDEPSKTGRTYREMATLGLLKGAISGNANNYRLILETMGELAQIEEDKQQKELTKVEQLLAKIEEEANK